jgi:hypothetical protein
MTVLHEVVESTLVSDYVRSPDRRWFCEGVANWLALEVIRERLGDERATRVYDVDALLARTSPGGFAALAKWPTAESAGAKHYPSELNQDNYVRATWVMRQIVAKQGSAFIAQWLTEIRKTPAENASIQTVEAAFRKLTNENLQAYLAGPAAANTAR